MMAAVSSSPVTPLSLLERTDKLLRKSDQLKPLMDQIKLLPPGTLHGLTGHTQGAMSLTEDFALQHLPLVQKISALVSILGLGTAYRELNLCPDTQEGIRSLSRAETFQQQVSELTEGIISSDNLNAYRVFRMRLLALMHKAQSRNFAGTPMRMGGSGNVTVIKPDVLFEQCEAKLENILQLLDLFLKEASEPTLVPDITSAIEFLGQLKSVQPNIPQSLAQDYRDAQTMLGLLQQAVQDPNLLMPILFKPLLGTRSILDPEMELHHFHPKTMLWANEFLMAFKGTKTRFLTFLEKCTNDTKCSSLKKMKQAKTHAQELIDELERQVSLYVQTFQLLRQFEAFSSEEQSSLKIALKSLQEFEKARPLSEALLALRQTPEGKSLKPSQLAFVHALNTLCDQLPATQQEIAKCEVSIRGKDRLEVFKTRLKEMPSAPQLRYRTFFEDFKEILKDIPDVPFGSTNPDSVKVSTIVKFKFDRGFRDDFQYCLMLFLSMGDALANTFAGYETIHENLNQMLREPFKRVGNVLVADLLHLEESQRFLALIALIEQDKIPNGQMLRPVLTDMHLQFEQAFMRMRNYYRHHNKPKRPSEDHNEDLALASAFKELPTQKLRAKYDHPEVIETLDFYDKLAATLNSAFTLDTWPKLFKQSPFATFPTPPQLEREFLLALFKVVTGRFQELELLDINGVTKQLLGFLHDPKEKAVCQGYEIKILRVLAPLISLQKKLRNRPAATLSNVDTEADYFQAQLSLSFTRMRELLHRVSLPLTAHLEEEGPGSSEFREVVAFVERLKSVWEPFLIDPARPLFNYLNCQRWLRAEAEAKARNVKAALETAREQESIEEIEEKNEIAEANAAPKPAALSPINSLEQLWSKFQAVCRRLPFISCGFTAQSEQAMRLNTLQAEAAMHLLGSLPALQELKGAAGRYGEKPFFINALYLKLAAAMEQAGQLSLAATHCQPIRNDSGQRLLMQKGAESYWKNHSPLAIYGQLEGQNDKVRLETSQKEWLKKLERVIAITSRRPTSGFDEMADELDASLHTPPETEEKRKAKCQSAVEKIQEGLHICLTLLTPVATDNSEMAPNEGFSAQIFEKPQDIKRDPARPYRVLKGLEERLVRLQALRLSEENRRVIPVSAAESTLLCRKGTIETCLMNLQAHVGLCRSILEAGDDPSICLLLTEQALLMEATMLEEALLILCSYLPVRTANGDYHVLWQEKYGKPLRYCHALSLYTDLLVDAGIKKDGMLIAKTQRWANDLESYLRNTYRYYRADKSAAGALREKMLSLSRLRQQGSDANNLDSHISKLLQSEVQANLLDLLEHVDELLGVYEEQLIKN